jgi:adenylate cyclase
MIFLRTFGRISLDRDGVPLPAAAHQRRRLALLVLLARSGEGGMAREKLIGFLWPDSSAERSRHALDQLVYATRRDLGHGAVVTRGGQLVLHSDELWSDCSLFDACLERAAWREAVELYTGPFLDGVYLGETVELERWVEAQRSELRSKFVAALQRLATSAGEHGDLTAAADWWRRCAAAEPLHEGHALRLVQALADAGDRSGALQHARTFSMLLREELGIEPGSRILQLSGRLAQAPDPLVETEPDPEPTPAPPAKQGEAGWLPPAESPGSVIASSDPAPPVGDHGLPTHARRNSRRRVTAVTAVMAGAGLALWLAVVLRPQPHDSSMAQVTPVASVAVLPFEDLSADGGAGYLGDGFSEGLIHALSQVPDLQVSARSSAFAFKGKRPDVRQIARALHVSTIVEGSVLREGDRLRVTARLIDASTGYQLWSGTFDRRMGDAWSTQDEIARSLVLTLRPHLTGRSERSALPRPAHRPDTRAYHLYLRGRHASRQQTGPSLHAAVGFFEQALQEDSAYAAAWIGLAQAHDALADGGFAPAERSYGNAEAAARQALRMDGSLAEAHAVLGHLKFHRWDWNGAEADFQRALDLNPGYAGTYANYAMPLVMQGRFDEGLDLMRRAQELDPVAMGTQHRMGFLLFLSRRYTEAVTHLRAVIAIDSASASAHARLGLSLVELGRYEEGIRELEHAVELGGGYLRSSLPMLGYGYARAGRRADAARVRARVEREVHHGTVNTYYAASLMGAMGERDRAFALLADLLETNRGCLIDVGVDPTMDSLRRDPRYAALLRALGLQVSAESVPIGRSSATVEDPPVSAAR